MPLSQLLRVLDVIESTGCPYWVEGGWGIDALAGRQTRDHRDVDIDFDATRENELIGALEVLGYHEMLDERPTRIELVAADGRCVDLHPLHLDPSGDARQEAPDGSWWHFRREWFTTGYIENRPVPCFTAEGQRYFHSGYQLRDVDLRDLATLDVEGRCASSPSGPLQTRRGIRLVRGSRRRQLLRARPPRRRTPT